MMIVNILHILPATSIPFLAKYYLRTYFARHKYTEKLVGYEEKDRSQADVSPRKASQTKYYYMVISLNNLLNS